jgi:uncharacterized protein (TIGR00369 family)
VTLEDTLGFVHDELGEREARGHVVVDDRHRQPLGVVHGGVWAALAESLVSYATALAVGEGHVALGMSNATSFFRPVSEGTVEARAERLHGGRTTWVWDVRFTDEAGRLCAASRIAVAVRAREAA